MTEDSRPAMPNPDLDLSFLASGPPRSGRFEPLLGVVIYAHLRRAR